MHLKLFIASAVVACAALPAQADSFTVNSWDLGYAIQVNDGSSTRTVNTARFDATLNGEDGASFCVDIYQYISQSTYQGPVFDPASDTSLNYTGAAELANAWAHNMGALSTATGASYREAITGLQASIWETLYGPSFSTSGLNSGSASVRAYVLGQSYSGYGDAVIIRFDHKQDQVFVPVHAVPEPGTWALLALGGLALLGAGRRRF